MCIQLTELFGPAHCMTSEFPPWSAAQPHIHPLTQWAGERLRRVRCKKCITWDTDSLIIKKRGLEKTKQQRKKKKKKGREVMQKKTDPHH